MGFAADIENGQCGLRW